MKRGLSFDEAVEAVRANNVFTTHTPVPAGIDLFDSGLVHYYFAEYCDRAGIPYDAFSGLGRRNPHDGGESFSMAILAIKTSCWRNAFRRFTAWSPARCGRICGPSCPRPKCPSLR
jgi:glycogen phosphorylase